ncbi:hypothetical protein BLNAU_18354 [Blattamonas nauphoetae]|uniref:Uncharacterized protein n=1 Tax=Blattamonas nauphoetae TaxID=2049346 RepID=A0ABQ9X4H9_9EUKA|nr:hypothetical protein BLNAU_18354 [Blattamonas nauphoetae]
MIVPSTCDSWATIRIELSTHRNVESHMLVPFCDVLPNTEIPLETVKTEEGSGSVSIVGTGLSLTDHSLSTQLLPPTRSLPTHICCTRAFQRDKLGKTDIGSVSPLSSQTLSASDISNVTNHFDGTALLDINSGATVLCVNSSVSHSVSDRHANADVTHTIQDKHLTARSTSSTVPSGTTHLSIIRCTFIVTTSAFGGAFYVVTYNVDKVTVTSCNFHQCKAVADHTSETYDGGALCLLGHGMVMAPPSKRYHIKWKSVCSLSVLHWMLVVQCSLGQLKVPSRTVTLRNVSLKSICHLRRRCQTHWIEQFHHWM